LGETRPFSARRETAPFTTSTGFDVGDSDTPDSAPALLWIGIGVGVGLVFLLAIAAAVFLAKRRRAHGTGSEEEDSEVAPPVEASSWEVSVLPVEECVEAFNPVASSGDGRDSADEFGIPSDEAEPV
jgi:hypothetical protein